MFRSRDFVAALIYDGLDWFTGEANQDGGIVVEVPMIDPVAPAAVRIEATGLTSGVVGIEDVMPIPSSSALWATSGQSNAIDVAGSPTIEGPVHSEGGIEATGNASFDNGAEYVGGLDLGGGVEIDPAMQVEAGATPPAVAELADTVAGLVSTVEIPLSECFGGRWRPTDDDLQSGVVHVPCDVELKSSRLDGPVGATIVADGKISLTGSRIEFATEAPSLLVSLGPCAAIDIAGSRHILGAVYADGPISVSGSHHIFTGEVVSTGAFDLTGGQSYVQCGIYAETIRLGGGNSTFSACPIPPG